MKWIVLFIVFFALPRDVLSQTKAIDNFRKNIYKKTRDLQRDVNKVKRDKNTIDRAKSQSSALIPKAKNSKDSSNSPEATFNLVKDPKIGKYSQLFTLINGKKILSFDNVDTAEDTIIWDEEHEVYYKKKRNIKVLPADYRNIIWYPYWEGEEYEKYNFNLISSVIFYAYNIDPISGNSNDGEGIELWKSGALVDSAHLYHKKVYLSATLYEEKNIATFLDNTYAQNIFIDSISSLIKLKNGDGVNLDFHPIPMNRKDKFRRFIEKLHAKLIGDNKASNLILNLPARGLDIDYNFLDNLVDLYIVMNYSNDNNDGSQLKYLDPSFSLKSKYKNTISYEYALAYYQRKDFPSNKIIFTIYDYVSKWKKTSDSSGYFQEYITYDNLNRLKYSSEDIGFDSVRSGNYLEIENTRYWYESKQSLSHKLNWVMDNKVAGVAFWTLINDSSHYPFWEAINQTVAIDSIEIVEPVISESTIPYRWTLKVIKYKSILLVSLFILFLATVFGVLFSLSDWRVRDLFFAKKMFRYLYLLVALFSICLFLFFNDGIKGDLLLLIIGIGLGFLSFLLFNKLGDYNRNKMP